MADLPSDVLETLERLDERERGYGKRMLPDPLDEAIARVVDFVVQAAPDEREDVKTLVGDTQARFLLAYGERMASLGLRRTSAPIVLSGLTAVALAPERLYFKEILVVLTPLYRAAQMLGEGLADAGSAVADKIGGLFD